jgi:hypothetical protein
MVSRRRTSRQPAERLHLNRSRIKKSWRRFGKQLGLPLNYRLDLLAFLICFGIPDAVPTRS